MLGAIVCTGNTATTPESARAVAVALRRNCDRLLAFSSREIDGIDHRLLVPDVSGLAAVACVLGDAGPEHAVIAAGDLLHPSSELIRYMVQIRGSFEAVIPERSDGSLEPLLAIYHPAVTRRIEGLIAAGERNLASLLDLVTVRLVDRDECAKFGDPDRLLERAVHSSM